MELDKYINCVGTYVHLMWLSPEIHTLLDEIIIQVSSFNPLECIRNVQAASPELNGLLLFCGAARRRRLFQIVFILFNSFSRWGSHMLSTTGLNVFVSVGSLVLDLIWDDEAEMFWNVVIRNVHEHFCDDDSCLCCCAGCQSDCLQSAVVQVNHLCWGLTFEGVIKCVT